MTHKSGFRANKREESDEVVVNRPNINTLQCSLNETNVTRGSRLWTGWLVQTPWCKAWPQTKLLPVYVRSVKDLIRKRNSDAKLLTTGRRKLNGTTTWQSPNWKPRIATVDSWTSRPCWVSSARCLSNEVIGWLADYPQMQIVMTSDETQIQIFADWQVSHAKRVTKDNRKNPGPGCSNAG